MFEQQAMLFATLLSYGPSAVAVLWRWLVFGNGRSDCSGKMLHWVVSVGPSNTEHLPSQTVTTVPSHLRQDLYLLCFLFQAPAIWEHNNLEILKANLFWFCNHLLWYISPYVSTSFCSWEATKKVQSCLILKWPIRRHTTKLKFWFISFKCYSSS